MTVDGSRGGHGARAVGRVRGVAALASVVALGLLAGPARASGGERGWGWLIDRLAADGVPRAQARAVFLDPRMDAFDGMSFGLHPREPHSMYRGHLSRDSLGRARRCRAAHADALRGAERAHGVSADVVAAIIHVESACGRNTGSWPILPPLARLAMAQEPENLARNIARHTAGLYGRDRDVIEARARARARQLDDMFYPQVRAAFEVARRLGKDPLAVRGSGAGAFGIPQFLPASYLEHGVDGDGDGVVSLYDHDDAIYSCARYLAAHGWRPGLSSTERRRVIWAYNHSDAYIDTVLTIADRLGGPDEPAVLQASAAPMRRVTAKRATTRRAVASRTRGGRKVAVGTRSGTTSRHGATAKAAAGRRAVGATSAKRAAATSAKRAAAKSGGKTAPSKSGRRTAARPLPRS